MESSSGKHYVALDHVRALAALLVFTWHFTHGGAGSPIPFEGTPRAFFLAIFDEGHTGVALFMTLSGYLFAKLLDGKRVHYPSFFWNRFLRLVPLLVVVFALVAVQRWWNGDSLFLYAKALVKGVYAPVWPNGGWSLTIEFHFYLLLPLLLWMARKSRYALVLVLIGAIGSRLLLHGLRGEVQSLAYWTLIGRIDQFLLGILAYQHRRFVKGRHALVAAGAILFLWYYAWFDAQGGFYLNISYPSPSLVWVIMPALEGAAYALAIAYYDNTYSPRNRGMSRFVGKIGAYSYSIYLLHFFVVFRLAAFVDTHIMELSNFYVACLWAVIAFVAMYPIGYLSFRFVESPFLRHRRPYTLEADAQPASLALSVPGETAIP